jgi:ribonuclease D
MSEQGVQQISGPRCALEMVERIDEIKRELAERVEELRNLSAHSDRIRRVLIGQMYSWRQADERAQEVGRSIFMVSEDLAEAVKSAGRAVRDITESRVDLTRPFSTRPR